MVEPQQGMTYERLVHVGRLARELGLEGIFRSDHYQPLGGEAADEPATDAWATLAGLVRDLADGVVGTLVSPVTFRHPGQLAKVVATVAHMSAGPTVELGLGTGWNEAEHKAYGFSFGTFGDRFRVLAEYLPVVKALLSGEEVSFEGEVYTLAPVRNRPAAPDVRIIVGGGGPRRTPRLAARYADEMNVTFMPPDVVGQRVETCKKFMADAGRDPSTFTFSWMGQFLIGRGEDDLRDRAGRLGSSRGAEADRVLGRLRGAGPVGMVDEAAAFFRKLADVGVTRVMLQHLMTDDDDHLALAADAAAAV